MIQQFKFSVVTTVLLVAVLAAVFPVFSGEGAGGEETAAPAQPARFVVYYLHGDMRCATCRKLEAYSEEAIKTGFAEELKSGAMAWRVVNTDRDEHKHFVKDFQLVTKSLVVVEYRDGKVARFENLGKIWQKVGDKDTFLDYVQEETRAFLDGA